MIKILSDKKIFIIILLAAILRLPFLDSFPPHLRNDEAALGYNAYSILETARDEHGNFLPLIFKAFGDWKMGLYIYLIVPFVAMLGLNEVAVRLPYALAGIVSVLFLYGVVLELFNKRTALAAAFLISISPLFVPMSRGAWDVTVGLTLAGIYFFLLALKDKNLFFLLSSFCFGISLLSSQAAKLSTPVILVLLIIIFFKDFKKVSIRIILLGFLIIFLFAFPVILSFSQGKVSRITTLSIFSYPSSNEGPIVYYTKAILSRVFNVYSFRTLFLKGDLNPQHGAPDIGPFLLMDTIFLLFGFIKVIQMGFTKQVLFILSLLFLLTLPSALTIEKVNLQRILTLFIPFLLIEALGMVLFWEKIKQKKWFLGIIITLYISNYIYFLDQYIIHGPKKNDAWQYGYKQIIEKISPIQNQYQKIIVQQGLEHPYIFFLFYQKYDPAKYQAQVSQVFIPNKDGKDMGLVSGIDNIKFEYIDWSKKVEQGVLYIMPVYKLEQQTKFYSDYKIVDEVKDLNGLPLFIIVEII